MIDGIFKKAMLDSFTHACGTHNALTAPEVFKVYGSPFILPFDRIRGFISRYWTDDFLDDLVVNEGSGVFMNRDFMIDFSRLFWSKISFYAYAQGLETTLTTGMHIEPASAHNVILNMVKSDIFRQRNIAQSVILPREICDHYTPVAGIGGSVENLEDFLTTHDWLIPLYLLYVTGVYDEVREALRNGQAVNN